MVALQQWEAGQAAGRPPVGDVWQVVNNRKYIKIRTHCSKKQIGFTGPVNSPQTPFNNGVSVIARYQVQRYRWVGMPAAKTQDSWQGSRVHYLKMPPGAATDCQRSAQKLPGTAASTVLVALPPAATLALAPAADGGLQRPLSRSWQRVDR